MERGTGNHQYGQLSDRVFDKPTDVLASYTTRVFLFIFDGEEYLSTDINTYCPVIGNRMCFVECHKTFLELNKGKIINQIRL